jgi:hypothetical protein
LKVTGPGGFQYIFTEDDLATSETLGQYFSANIPNPPSNGIYTFSVTDSAGRTITTTKDFTFASVPRVDYTTMLPVDNTYVNTQIPTLSWGSVGPGYYYKVVISDWNGNESPLYMSNFIQDTSITIPSGYLLPNTPYRWRVDAYDSTNGNNRSRSNLLQFSTGISGYTPQFGLIFLFGQNNHYNGLSTSIAANVLGPLPNAVTLFNVTGPGLSHDFQQTDIVYNLASGGGSFYTFGQLGVPTDGSYNFSLQTPNGNLSPSKSLTRSDIPIVDQSTLSPANNAYLTNLTPTFSWAAVTGSSRYYRIVVEDWRQRFIIYTSARSTDLFATIPAGVLKPNRSYMWRVEVWDNTNADLADNRSLSGRNCFTTPREWMIDFEGDARTDAAVYDVANGWWFFLYSSTGANGFDAIGVGGGSQWVPVAGDYDGDGKMDVAVYDTVAGWWLFHYSGGGYFYDHVGQGGTGFTAVPGDYDGDGTTDLAVYQQSTGYWFIKYSSGGYGFKSLGGPGKIPVQADYDGDGKTDIAVYDVANGWWFFLYSSTGGYGFDAIGVGGGSQWVPVPGDYDGDGKADVAVYDAVAGWWLFHYSGGGYFYDHIGQGGTGFTAVPGYYDADGTTDLAVYQQSTGYWFIKYSLGGYEFKSLGGPGYIPVR